MFLKTVEKSFLGINDPSKHKHAVKNLCSESLVLKVQNLYNYIDRQYVNSSYMKPLQLILINGTEKLTAYLTELEEQMKEQQNLMKSYAKTQMVKTLSSDLFLLILPSWKMFGLIGWLR